MNKIHLICNAHLDPVWLWEWEEGAAEAISTFRVAADFCEEYDGFVFNHNEVMLYKWVEEYEPDLFRRIQKLVESRRWHIMGGWYLQPDCNMPSGESIVRQILSGRRYFMDKFGAEPSTAINFDPFGHSRGLVQVLKKSGFDSYIFCKPGMEDMTLPSEEFIWLGYDDSEVTVHRGYEYYLSLRGEARSKVEKWMKDHKDKPAGMVLWGIGNHGGGPSQVDLENLKELMEEAKEYKIVHSTPEKYFKELKSSGCSLPTHTGDINPHSVGCYSSQIRVKQKHRLLENEIYTLEKMMSNASIQCNLEYPQKEIHEALCDLMVSEFHDILPGSSIQPVEEAALRLLDHGLEIVSRLKARAFFALAAGQDKAKGKEIPILVYNPHPFKIKGIFECEFQLPDQNWKGGFSYPRIYKDGEEIYCQAEKELSNLNFLDWRKRAVFEAELEPGQMNRFDCIVDLLPEKPAAVLKKENGNIVFKTDELEVVINCKTGLVDKYVANDVSYLMENAFEPLVIDDSDDAWAMNVKSFPTVIGRFGLMNREEGTIYSGVTEQVLDSVRIIEDGAVRSVIEAVFSYGNSYICQTYKLPKHGTEIQVNVRVHWNEKSKMLKLSVPTSIKDGKYIGQVIYGAGELPDNGCEAVAQKWVAVVSEKANNTVTCINDGTYGSDFRDGEMRLTLLRSPGYSGHPYKEEIIMPQDRYSSRIDQGEREFNFWFNAGEMKERLEHIDREALIHNEKPFALSFFPSGTGMKPAALAVLSDNVTQMTVFKKAEDSDDYIIRLFEPTGQDRSTIMRFPAIDLDCQVDLKKFEIKTLRLNVEKRTITPVNLMEK